MKQSRQHQSSQRDQWDSTLELGSTPSRNEPFKACFATLTVFDDELTEGNEIGYGLVCKAQGF